MGRQRRLRKNDGALDGIRTRDLILTKNALYRLSYEGNELLRCGLCDRR